MQIGALGKLLQKRMQRQRPLVRVAGEDARGAGFRLRGGGLGRWAAAGKKQSKAGKQKDGTAHDPISLVEDFPRGGENSGQSHAREKFRSDLRPDTELLYWLRLF
jgi:hypothetical protein